MKNIKMWNQFLKEDVETPEMIEQKPKTQVSTTNKIEVSQDNWQEWRTKIDPSTEYATCEVYVDENDTTLTIIKPSISLSGQDGLMVRYTKTEQTDTELESKLEDMKKSGTIERMHFMTLVKPEGFLTHLGNLKSISK